MNKIFLNTGWEDYLFWQTGDKKILKKINDLIKDIERNGNDGLGNPEALKYDLSGFYSRKINSEHRLVYKIDDDNNNIYIMQCRYHYTKK